MVKTKIGRIILGVLCVAALLAIPSAAAAQASTFVILFERVGEPELDVFGNPVPGTGAFMNPCTAEAVDVIGSTTITISQQVTRDGDVRTNIGAVTKGTGVGAVSAASYSFAESQQFTLRIPALGTAFDSTFSDKLWMNGARAIDNWSIRATFRVKVSTTGEILVTRESMTGDVCKG